MRASKSLLSVTIKEKAVAGVQVVMSAAMLPDNLGDGGRGPRDNTQVQRRSMGVVNRGQSLHEPVSRIRSGPSAGKVSRFDTNKHPIQSLMRSEYQAKPDLEYDFEVVAMYGPATNLEAYYTAEICVRTQ